MARLRSSLFPVVVALLLARSAGARDFAPGEQVWCDVCRGYVDAPHSEAHRDMPYFGFCEKCEGFFEDATSRMHRHLGDRASPSPPPRPVCLVCGTALGSDGKCPNCASAVCPTCGTELDEGGKCPNCASSACPTCGTALGSDGKCPNCALPPLFRQYLRWGSLAVGGVFLFSLLVSILVRLRTKKRKFTFVKGVPQGIALHGGTLVCEQKGSFDGGTSQVYEALFRNESGKWEPAFAKRIIGAGMRADQRFPMLEFEANVLRRLEPTGAVPRVLVAPETVSLSDGTSWSYYAMSAARGTPWPAEKGGLGSDTRAALADLCRALKSLHGFGIGHHDLKPQNIFWDSRRKRVTLLDFGSAIDHKGEFANPIGGTMTGTKPWIPPASDGKILNDLTALSDNWVYGLLFCEALVGGVCAANRTLRRTPEKQADRDWFREQLTKAASPAIADAVVDGLFAFDKTRRMKLQEFLAILGKEWGVSP